MKESVRLHSVELTKRALQHAKPSFDAPTVILDTNIVMDILVFKDPSVAPIVKAIDDDRLIPLLHPETFAELVDVLGRSMFKLMSDEVDAKALDWHSRCRFISGELPPNTYCKDQEDDKFFQLALLTHCPFLITKDKLVLKARKRAKRDAIAVMTVADFVQKELEHGNLTERLPEERETYV